MVYIYNAPEAADDTRYDYQWTVLRAALERTNAKYGPFKLVPSPPMSEKRQVYALMNNTGDLSVMYLGVRPELRDKLVSIPIPIDKDLEGYCVFLVNKADEKTISAVHAVEDLKRFSIGLGYGWIDVDILEANGLNVRTGDSYDGLFKMLAQHRFDIFLRSSVEVLDEVKARGTELPSLTIERKIALYYPMPMYFWFANSIEGKRLAARVEEGLWAIINDGTFDALFEKYQRAKIDKLDLAHRRIIRISNPFFSKPGPPYNDPRLWFDPQRKR